MQIKDFDLWVSKLDRMEHEVTDGEAEFLEKVMTQRKHGLPLIQRQKDQIDMMVRRYWRYVHDVVA
jgi:hypothetical protein